MDCDVHYASVVDKCGFIKNNTGCSNDGSIQYTEFIYCNFSGAGTIAALILLASLLLCLLLVLSIAADNFLSINLVAICQTLRLSHNIAGVTFLAFANGAPDVFSSIAALSTSDRQNTGLLFGGLLGAGVFVTTVVTAAVAFTRPFSVMQRPLLRDIVFYLWATYLTFYVLYTRRLTLTLAILYISLYILYVFTVIFGRWLRKWLQRRKMRDDLQPIVIVDDVSDDPVDLLEEQDPSSQPVFVISDGTALGFITDDMNDSFTIRTGPRLSVILRIYALQIWSYMNPVAKEEFIEATWYQKAYMVATYIPTWILRLTIPVTDEERTMNGFCKPVLILHCFTAPLMAMVLTNSFAATVGGFPVIVIVFAICSIPCAWVMRFTGSSSEPHWYKPTICFIGFIFSVIWIYAVANEIVSLLESIGLVLEIEQAVLGLTVLAWANSLGDLISNVAVAKQGYPRVAISACFAGPMFNLLVGVGIASITALVKDKDKVIEIVATPTAPILYSFLAISLIISLIAIPLCRFYVGRVYAVCMFAVYGSFMVCAITVSAVK